jgi:AcrR family transcriptional regulator
VPTPRKTSTVEILAAAAEMIEAGGIRSLTMLGIAKRVGIKGASLYKHFPDADAVLLALEEKNFSDLGRCLAEADRSALGMAESYLAFCRQRPEQTKLLFRKGDAAIAYEAMRKPLDYLAELLGDREEALLRLRILTCMLQGYCSMIESAAFRQGGAIDQVAKRAIELIVPEEQALAGMADGLPRP